MLVRGRLDRADEGVERVGCGLGPSVSMISSVPAKRMNAIAACRCSPSSGPISRSWARSGAGTATSSGMPSTAGQRCYRPRTSGATRRAPVALLLGERVGSSECRPSRHSPGSRPPPRSPPSPPSVSPRAGDQELAMRLPDEEELEPCRSGSRRASSAGSLRRMFAAGRSPAACGASRRPHALPGRVLLALVQE